jgi:hypothetical protein
MSDPSRSLTLAGLMGAMHGDAFSTVSMRLMRHSFTGDRAILRARFPSLDPAGLGVPLLSADDKVGALRLDPQLVEVFSSEQGTDKLASGGQRASLMLAFAKAGPDSAEFLGAWDVQGVSSLAEYEARYASYLLPMPPALGPGSSPART